MSFQVAMMAGMAAMTVAQGVSQASQAGAAARRGIAGLHEAERQAAIEANIRRSGLEVEQAATTVQKMGHEVAAGGYLTQAAQTDVTAGELRVATRQQELARRRALMDIQNANAVDLIARGGIATGFDSAAAIADVNKARAEEDIFNTKFMSESAQKQLSFKKKNFEISAMGEGLRSIFADIAASPGLKRAALEAGAEGKQRALELQVADAGARASEATTSAILAAGGKLFSLGAMYESGGGGKKAPGSGEIA